MVEGRVASNMEYNGGIDGPLFHCPEKTLLSLPPLLSIYSRYTIIPLVATSTILVDTGFRLPFSARVKLPARTSGPVYHFFRQKTIMG